MSDTPFTNNQFTPPLGAGGTSPDPAAGTEGRPFGEKASSQAARAGARMADQIGESAGRTVSQAGDAIAQGLDAAQTTAQEVQSWAQDKHEAARRHVRTNPMSSIAITFGAGMLLGLLLRRR